MNRQWSEENKRMQTQLQRRETFDAGMDTLFALREQLMQTLCAFRGELCREDFSAMPFPNANGYHSKTIAYSIWHIFRIEDIVAHCVIGKEAQVLSSGGYQDRIRSPIITTGNELAGRQIAAFSAQLDLDALYAYAAEVKESTEALLRSLSYDALKQKIPPDRRELVQALGVVSSDESAVWLIDFWCGKDVHGLIQMPFSRHWIMHTEACLRIRAGLQKKKQGTSE